MSNMSPTFRFGRYKGRHLSEADSDYLSWLARQSPETFKGTLGGKPAPIAAKEELERRESNTPISPGLPIETEFEEGLSFPTLGAKVPTLTSSDDIEVCIRSLDQGLNLLLREFLNRTTEEKYFSDWLKNLAKEVLQYGKEEDYTTKEIVKYNYVKLNFYFKVKEKTLVGIKK